MADQTHRMDDGHAPGSDTPAPARRSSGSRGADVRDAVAEMTVRAHEISQDAGAKMSTALRDVINAAAGLAGFAVESARDLVQFMVRRGQMSASEAELLLRDAEAAHARQLKANPPKAQPTAAGGSTRGGAAEKAPARASAAKAGTKSGAKSGAKAAPAKPPAKAAAKAPARKATKAAAPAKAAAAKGAAKSSGRAVTKAAKPARGTSAKAGAKTAPARKPATKATPARKPVKRK